MKYTIPVIVCTLLLSINGICYCESNITYEDTVKTIKYLLPGISSDIRKETYGYIEFNKCILDYNVSGNYPVGTSYNKTFNNVDFSSLNSKESKIGADLSVYILLFFDKPFNLIDGLIKQTSMVAVIDAATHAQAQTLFRAFLRMGELCQKNEPE